ncbi:MAG: FHA domain-containing protein, partial [Deltaproteobacteria bacterium]|nr:FHA domain-containing protein [Deltaproteobacteria bacterium]
MDSTLWGLNPERVLAMSMLYVINGPEKGREFPLHEETATVGRAPGNTVQLKDRSISRNHLKITRTEGKYCITDLGTTNGTFISGKRIPPNKPFEVDAGQPIAIGNVFFSLASPYEGDDRSVQELIDLAGRLSDGDMAPIQDRPMTLKKNMELVSKVSRALSGSSDIRDILEKTLSYIFELLDRIDRGVIILTDPETG